MCAWLARPTASILLTCFLLFLMSVSASADGKRLIAVSSDHVAIRGYDTVAYFTDGKAMKGSAEFEYTWSDAKWWFASAAHRDLFIADPDHYMPQFGGFCAFAITHGVLVPANPEAWAIVDGKLYMVAGEVKDIDKWKADAAYYIQRANASWPSVQGHWAAQQQ